MVDGLPRDDTPPCCLRRGGMIRGLKWVTLAMLAPLWLPFSLW